MRPKIRFKSFSDDWISLPLSELLKEFKQTNKDLRFTKDDVLSVSGELGVVNQIQHLGRSYAGVSVLPYKIILNGHVVYTKSPLKSAPFGIVKFNKGVDGIVSTLYAIYSVNELRLEGSFLDYYFSLSERLNNYLRPLVRKGAKNDMKINNSQVLVGEVIIPGVIEEQQKIASFLSLVDEKITKLKEKKELLEQYKKGIMQQIFSQEIRFKDENGDDFPEWEEYSLSNVTDRITTKNKENNLNVLTISAQQGLINQEKYFNKSVAAKNLTGYYLLQKGDFAYNKSYSNGYPLGAIKLLKNYDKGVVSTLYICFKFNNLVLNEFAEHYFESGSHNKEIELIAQEGARNHGLLNVGVKDFFNTNMEIPSIIEQEKISDFLTKLDQKISATSSKIELMETWKKGLLQQMFV